MPDCPRRVAEMPLHATLNDGLPHRATESVVLQRPLEFDSLFDDSFDPSADRSVGSSVESSFES
jgi:hypothetical protein